MITAGTNFSLPAEAEKADSVFFAWGMGVFGIRYVLGGVDSKQRMKQQK